MMKWLLAPLCFFLLLSQIAFTQPSSTATLSGKVTTTQGKTIPGVAIVDLSQPVIGTTTDVDGNYRLDLEANVAHILEFRLLGYQPQKQTITLTSGEQRQLNITLAESSEVLDGVKIEATRSKTSTMQEIDKRNIEVLPNVSGGIEAILRTFPGVTANNELSSQYSVRGGNFDENLVYVNDFEIYRPFLMRSGQQEGLSFINPDLVSSIGFSAGGFEARYGDKMASVLDVKYKRPTEFAASVGMSLLGGSAHIEGSTKQQKLTYIAGIRYKTNQYLLNSLPTAGQYSPSFADAQTFITYQMHPRWQLQLIGNYARNDYQFIPVSSETSFGTFQESYKLNIFFNGSEHDRYQTLMGGAALVYNSPNDRLRLKLMSSAFKLREVEAFNIIGAYSLGEVEKSLSEEDFGQTIRTLGVGSYHDWARNRLNTNIANAGVRGNYILYRHFISWGTQWQHEKFDDQINEWYRTDSAGYAIPYTNTEIAIADRLRTNNRLQSNRITAFAEDEWAIDEKGQWAAAAGVRFNYWSVNQEYFVTPRFQIAFSPRLKARSAEVHDSLSTKRRLPKRYLTLRMAVGGYYQPAFYREMRNLDGELNTQISAQKSIHAVLGATYDMAIWKRPFKLTGEVYYKQLRDLVPYDMDNTLLRYYGDNLAKGYAAGADLRLNGEFVPGTDSWISLSYLTTKEDLKDDHYYDYLNAAGNIIQFWNDTTDRIIVDSLRHDIGYRPRPTDQRFNIALFFQDYLPNRPDFKVHLMLVWGGGLPSGPIDNPRFRNTSRLPVYRRADIGFSAMLFNRNKRGDRLPERSPLRVFESIWVSAEIFNLFGTLNTISYNFIKALSPDLREERIYHVPNYLTSRRFNVRMLIKF